MPTNSQAFFDEYARAYESYNAASVAEMYFVPAVIMSDESKNVFTSVDDLAGHVQELMNKLQQVGVVRIDPEVCQTMRLSENIMFSNVNWKFSDVQGQKIFSCFVSYTLQQVDDHLKVIVSVIDDEERELAKLLLA